MNETARVNVAGLVKRRVISWQTIANKFLNRREACSFANEFQQQQKLAKLLLTKGIILQRNNSATRRGEGNARFLPTLPDVLYVSTIREARFREEGKGYKCGDSINVV